MGKISITRLHQIADLKDSNIRRMESDLRRFLRSERFVRLYPLHLHIRGPMLVSYGQVTPTSRLADYALFGHGLNMNLIVLSKKEKLNKKMQAKRFFHKMLCSVGSSDRGQHVHQIIK